MIKHKVTFLPDEKEVWVGEGTTLLMAAQEAGVYVNSICGGEMICGKCRLILKEGPVEEESHSLLSREEVQRGYILACVSKPKGDVVVEVPEESRLKGGQILMDVDAMRFRGLPLGKEKEELYPHQPLVEKMYLPLEPPTLQDSLSDLERVMRGLRSKGIREPLQAGLSIMRTLPNLLRSAQYRVTVTVGQRGGIREILQVEKGNTQRENFGVALDLGTTTIVAHLLNLNTAETLDAEAAYNRQIEHGEDVISRLIHVEEKEEGARQLRDLASEVINSLIAALVSKIGIKLSEISCCMCAGNTIMVHLLLELDSSYIRKAPYVPCALHLPALRAVEAGIRINPRGLLYCMPGVSSYVGGDVVAGVLASGMALEDGLGMFIDVGTNGEIVIGNKDWLVCCSASAGPAFEGGQIKWGMRAVHGAIEGVTLGENCKVELNIIDQEKPLGICGSGLIDSVAELLKAGIIDRTARFQKVDHCKRLRQTEDGCEFILASKEETGHGQDIVLTQADITSFIHSKAAIFAGASVLIKSLGLDFSQLQKIYIAGGFGNYLDIDKAVFIGLLPDISPERISFIGNGSVQGAKMALLSLRAFEMAMEIAQKMTYVDLSANPLFYEEFISAQFLPHTNLDLFPSLKGKKVKVFSK